MTQVIETCGLSCLHGFNLIAIFSWSHLALFSNYQIKFLCACPSQSVLLCLSQSLSVSLSTASFLTHESPWWLPLPVSPPPLLLFFFPPLFSCQLSSHHPVPNSAPLLSSPPHLTFLPLISTSSLLAPLVTPIALSAALVYPFLSCLPSLCLSSAWHDTASLKHHDTSLVSSRLVSSRLVSSPLELSQIGVWVHKRF